MSINIKRIYEPAGADDGKRILVDRLWPRGVSKERAQLYEWMKDVAPSGELRQWFGHDPGRMEEFAGRYRLELSNDVQKRKDVDKLLDMEKEGRVTLLYAAKDPKVNHAAVLAAYLEEKLKGV